MHEGKIKVIDNIPIQTAREIFETEAKMSEMKEIAKVKEKIIKDKSYQPNEKDLDNIKTWMSNPEIYLDEGQLKRIYDYPQGNLWDFFLHALGIKKIPTLEDRIEYGYDGYIKTYNYTDEQLKVLQRIKDIFAVNIVEKKVFTADDIFSNPLYERMLGGKQEVDKIFNGKFDNVLKDLEKAVKV